MNKNGMNDVGKKRLLALLDKLGLEMKEASLAAGLGATYVRDVLKRGRGGRAKELAKLANSLNVSLEFLMGAMQAPQATVGAKVDDVVNTIRISGKVGAGIWFETNNPPDAESFGPSMFPPDTRYPLEAQFDLEVTGSSLDKIAREGDLIRCVSFDKAGMSPQNGDLVIVERTRMGGQLCETTVKFYHQREGHIELRPRSDDPRWQEPIIMNGGAESLDTVVISALVLYAYRPLGRA